MMTSLLVSRPKGVKMNLSVLGRMLLLVALLLSWAAAAALAEPVILKSSSSSFGKAVLELDTDELVAMKVIPFRLQLLDDDGAVLTGAKVSCDMDMPSMTMPENRPKVVAEGDVYTGEMIFTCTMGAWRITFDAEHSDGRHQGATFYVERVKMQ